MTILEVPTFPAHCEIAASPRIAATQGAGFEMCPRKPIKSKCSARCGRIRQQGCCWPPSVRFTPASPCRACRQRAPAWPPCAAPAAAVQSGTAHRRRSPWSAGSPGLYVGARCRGSREGSPFNRQRAQSLLAWCPAYHPACTPAHPATHSSGTLSPLPAQLASNQLLADQNSFQAATHPHGWPALQGWAPSWR